jgi:hypothetical protein
MGTTRSPKPVMLFMAMMYSPQAPIETILNRIDTAFGERAHHYGPVLFDFSDYYEEEMGAVLYKSYYTFSSYIDRTRLPAIKNFTNEIEQQFTNDAKRCVNLDPGYITNDKLVLATTKDFFHRLYLTDGIYAEVTLHFRKGSFRHFSWTYPDYRYAPFHAFLEKARAQCVGDTRKM